MGVDPNSGELFRSPSCVNLLVKEIGYRFIVECNMRPGADLFDKLHILDEQQVVAGCDTESANLGVPEVTQEQ